MYSNGQEVPRNSIFLPLFGEWKKPIKWKSSFLVLGLVINDVLSINRSSSYHPYLFLSRKLLSGLRHRQCSLNYICCQYVEHFGWRYFNRECIQQRKIDVVGWGQGRLSMGLRSNRSSSETPCLEKIMLSNRDLFLQFLLTMLQSLHQRKYKSKKTIVKRGVHSMAQRKWIFFAKGSWNILTSRRR